MGRLVKLEKEPERRLGDLNAGTGKKGRLVLIDTEPQRRLGELGKSAAAPAAAEKPAPKPSLAGASRAVTDTGTGDAAAERGARRQRYERQLRDIQKQQHARQLGAKNTAGAEEIEKARRQAELRKRLATLDLIDNYGQRNHEDTYGGYIKSQYDIGQLGQDQARAWSAVMRNPTAANLEYAQHVDSMIEDYTQRNQQALDPTGNHLFYSEDAPEWLQKAGKWADDTIGANVQYLPQAKEQFFASIVPAVLGLMAGGVTGGKLGYSLGTALYSASTMAGSAYQALRELGADHETAKQLATDEAFLSSLIEGADTFADLSLFGFGKAAGKLGANVGKAGLVQAAKQFGASGAGKALGFLGNIAQEGLEEGTQQAVSIANRERYLRGYDPAEENFFQQVGGLTGDAARIFWNGLKRDDPNHQEIMESAKGGAQVAIGMGALGFGTGAVTNRVMGDITGLNDPRNALLYEGQSQGMTDPRAQLMQETEPAARPVTEPVTGNVTEPVTENAPPALQAAPVQLVQQAQDGEAILNALAGDMAREEARQNRALREQEAARREQEYLQAVQTQNRILEETEAQADAERYAMSAEVARKSGGGLLQDEYTDTLDRRDMTVLDAAARQLGVTVSFAGEINHGRAEGQITGRAITLQRDAESPLRQLFGHEIAHRLRDLAPKEFDRFVQAVKAADPDFSGKVAEMLALGQRADDQYSEPVAIEDVAADYAGMLLDKPQTLETFITKNQHNPTLLQRLGQIFRELAQKLKGKLTGQQRTQAENAAAALEKAYAAAVKAERKNGAEREGAGTRYSFARLRDESIRQQAEAMERSGSSPEEIWKTLGIARTMDGKGWRFEIDDSGLQLRGDAADLSNYTTLGELVDAPELFEAYPQLKDVRLAFADLEDGERGYFSSGDNTIVLSEEFRGAPEDTLVHEIQHAIQDVEGFASGASPEYWARREYANGDLVTERLQREYDRTLNRLSRADQNQYIRYMELERELDRLFLSDENSEDGKRYAKLETEQDALYEALYPNQWFRDLLDLSRRMTDAPGEYLRMYENTAGEIEARDAASRRRMTAEERRATMPKMADENTVFAEGGTRSDDYIPGTVSKEKIREGMQTISEMETVASLSGDEFKKSSVDLVTQVSTFFDGIGNMVYNPQLGDCTLNRRGVKDDIAHGIGRKKAAAFAAVPAILEKGKVIDYQQNWKGRNYDTAVVAAPISIADERYLAGVVLLRENDENRFYVHEVLIEKGTSPFKTGESPKVGVDTGGDAPSIISLLKKAQNVNPRYSLKRDAALEKDFASIREQLEAGKLTEEQADRLREEAVDRAAQRTPDFKALEQENAALRKRVERLQRQTKITERPVVREGDISRLANDLLKGYESRADRREIQKQLRALGDFIVQNGSEDAELTWDTAKERAMAIADQIVEQASVLNDSTAEDYREIRQYFRETPLVISKEDSADIPDFADFKRSQRGRLRVQLGERGNIGSVFSDIAARWPGFFNAEDTTNPGDQLARMADVMEALRPVYENPYGGSMGYVKEAVANDILDGLLSQQVRQEAATFADRQARKLQEQRSRYLSILEKEKAKRREAVAAAKEHGKQALRLQTERRGQSQRREQIKRHIGALSARLLNPSDSKNIPEGLRQPIARALSMIDLDSKRTGDDRRQALQALRSAYLDIIRDGSSGVVVDPELLGDSAAGAEGMLEQLAAMRSVPLAEMNRAELETVWKVVRSLEHAVSTAGKTLASQKFETTKDWARAFASDASGRRSKSIILKGAFPRMQDMLDPRSFFDQYGESGLAVWRMLRNAQDSVTQKVQMVAEQVGDVIDADFVRRARRETHTFTTEEGKALTLTTGQIMNLYNLMQREQAQEHLMKGGVIQPEVGTGRKKIARGTEAIRLTLNDQQRIVSVLDPQARIAAQTLQRLTTGLLADWGNEASLKAYGYRKFTEKNYWPIKSAAEELHSNVEKGENNTRSIKNIGMAKKVIPHANNALELGDALDVFARHTADMVEYSSWLLPMEDANRLFNFAFRDEKGNRTGKTIKGELNRVGGAGSTQYWQRLMEDIQNGIRVRADTNAERSVSRIVGNAKGAAVGANLRVVLQQPTAFLRANAVISPASLSKGLLKGVTGGNGWRKAVRWAGIARIKEVGGFDQGGFRTINQQLYGRTDFLDRASAAAGLGAEKADAVTWGALWNASEWETRRLHPALEAGSDAFYRRTAEIFTDLIEQSQVVDGVLQRSQIMRSGNAFNQMATAFMGEPLKTLNMLLRSLDKLRYETDGKKRSAARKQLGRTAAALEDWRGVVQDLRRGSPNLNWEKINSAVERFRKIYDELFQRLNDVRVRNGYEPINYRSGYFPHFQPGDGGDGILSQFGRAMGIDTQVTALPTSINGLTHNFKPGITWFGNAQERKGFNTAYDAVEGFDKYIEGAASVIFQTENIQRLRALATQMRYRTGDEGLRKQVDAVRADPRLTEEEKQSKINEIHKEGRFVLSNFVNELDEYTNLLANKKSRFDRGIEAALGRRVYSFLKNWESRVGANMIAGNLSSALTNFIPLTQARGQIGRASMLKGMWDTLKSYRNDDGFADRSSFLTNRRGSDPIVKSWSQKASGVLGKPMEYIDTFTADSIVRARYDQNLRRGLSEAEAMSEADAFAGKVMADRSKGSMPTLFESKNPIFKAFTQFQLEVNNQFSEVFKDLPRAYRDKGLAALAAALFKYFIGAFLFNEVYEYIVGRRPALDPIGLLNDTAGDLTGYALPNLVELGVGAAQGELPSFQTEKASLGETGKTLAKNALGELPFSSGLALLGADIDGGRLPAASAVPDLTALWDAATKEGWSGKRRWKEVQDELSKLAYILPPFGGNQAQKIWKSVKALLEGGSYTMDADGSRKLQYPVFTDDPWETALNAGRMMLFGKSSLPTAQDWVEDNFNTLGAKQTAAYQDMLEAGVRGEDAFALLQELRGAEKTDEQSRNAVQREILRRSDVPGEGKAITYYALLASDRERELMDALDGADPGAVTEMLLDIKDANRLKGAAASSAKREAIAKAPLTDEEKQTVYRYITGTKQEDGSYTTSREDDIMAFEQAGLDFDTFLKVQNEYTAVNEKYSGASEKALAFSRWVNSLDLTAEQAETVRDCFRYFSQIPAKAARYDSFVSAGLDDDAAYALANSLNALEPEEGKKTVSYVQRYRAVLSAELSEDEQLAALQELMQESEYSKLQVGYSYGVTPEAYVTFRELLPQYDADGNGTLNQKEVEKALDSMGGGVGLVLPGDSGGDQPLTVKQQAVLWQLANKSWRPNKNPYSTSVGRKVYDALNAEPVSGGILLPDGTGGLELPRG